MGSAVKEKDQTAARVRRVLRDRQLTPQLLLNQTRVLTSQLTGQQDLQFISQHGRQFISQHFRQFISQHGRQLIFQHGHQFIDQQLLNQTRVLTSQLTDQQGLQSISQHGRQFISQHFRQYTSQHGRQFISQHGRQFIGRQLLNRMRVLMSHQLIGQHPLNQIVVARVLKSHRVMESPLVANRLSHLQANRLSHLQANQLSHLATNRANHQVMGKIVAMRAETNQISQAMDMIAVRKAVIDLPSLQPNRRKIQEANETFPQYQAITIGINVTAILDTPERTAKQKSTSANQTRVRMEDSVWTRLTATSVNADLASQAKTARQI
jgi:hypothetical protein